MTSNETRTQQQRENPEPEEGTAATPKPVILWIAILIVWGVGYYAWQIGKPMLGGDSRSPVEVTTHSSASAKDTKTVESTENNEVADNSAEAQPSESAESGQAAENTEAAPAAENNETASVDGEQVFSAHCAACHQANGQGIPGAFPPLSGSKWVMAEDPNLPLAIVHDGLSGEIEVAGTAYNGVMPPFKGTLSSEELAAVLTYVRNEWDNKAEGIDVAVVEKHNESFGDRGPWTVEELKQTFQTP